MDPIRNTRFTKSRGMNFAPQIASRRISDSGLNYYSDDSEEESDNEIVYQSTKTIISELFNETDFKKTRCSYLPPISDQNIDFLTSNSRFFEQKRIKSIQTMCLLGIYPERLQFHQQQRTHFSFSPSSFPEIVMWSNTGDLNSVDYKANIDKYMRTNFSKISKLKISIETGKGNTPLIDRVKACRRDVPDARVMIHYIGLKYQKIDENGILLSDPSKKLLIQVHLTDIFEYTECPSVYLMDCNNAACVLKMFETIAKRKSRTMIMTRSIRAIDWSDWVCFCSTDIGEELPIDCHLPTDFLTSCVLTPAETALCCHILQFFRVTHVAEDFPLDGSLDKILADKKDKLTHTILTITDAIAAMCFPENLYDQLIRKDPVIKRLTEGFLLCQFLLKPYMIHPQSKPALPDLSSHRLWKLLKTELDQFIYASMMENYCFVSDSIFKKAITTISNDNFSDFQTALFSILLNSVGTDYMIESFSILAKHASFGESQQKMLARNAKFSALFTAIIEKKPTDQSFHSLCYLALVLLCVEPNFVYDTPQTLDYSVLVNGMFNKALPSDTRTLVIALVTSLAVSSNGQIQQVSEKPQIVEDLLDSVDSDPEPTLWIFLLAKKFMEALNAKPRHIISGGYHVRVASFFLHASYEVRAAVMPLIQAYIGFDPAVDSQLFLMTMFAVFDCSSLVRFSYLSFLGKFLMHHSQKLPKVSSMKLNESYQELCKQWTTDESKPEAGESPKLEKLITDVNKLTDVVDEISEKGDILTRCISIALFSVLLLHADPNPSVASQAVELSKNIGRSPDKEADLYTYSSVSSSGGSLVLDSEIQLFEHCSRRQSDIDGYCCSSDLLYRISLRQLVDSRCYKHENVHQSAVIHRGLPPCSVLELGDTNVSCKTAFESHDSSPSLLYYDFGGRDMCVALRNNGIFFRNKSIHIPSIVSLAVADWKNTCVIAGDTNGSVSVWNPDDGLYVDSFKCDLVRSSQPVVIQPLIEKPHLLTSRGIGGVIRMWDVDALRFAGEWQVERVDSSMSPCPVSSICVSPTDSNVVILGYSHDKIEMIDMRTAGIIGSLTVSGSIFTVCSNVAEQNSFFAATKEGIIYRFYDTEHVQKIVMESEITGFDVNERVPLMSIAQSGQPAVIATLDGKPLHVLQSVRAVSVASHQVLPIVSFGTTDGSVIECEITI